jgi:plasmid maintenance system killer protein
MRVDCFDTYPVRSSREFWRHILIARASTSISVNTKLPSKKYELIYGENNLTFSLSLTQDQQCPIYDELHV